MGFDPCNCSMKIRKSIGTPIPQSGSSFGNVKVHSLTLSYIPGNMKCDSRASLFALTFANPCIGREPKAKVATWMALWTIILVLEIFNKLRRVGMNLATNVSWICNYGMALWSILLVLEFVLVSRMGMDLAINLLVMVESIKTLQ
jgi:hypothetical protein